MDSERFTALEAHYNAILPTLATKADIEALRAEMHKMSADTHKWMIASLIGLFIGFGGLGVTISQILKPQAQSASTQIAGPTLQPIIIYVSPPPQK